MYVELDFLVQVYLGVVELVVNSDNLADKVVHKTVYVPLSLGKTRTNFDHKMNHAEYLTSFSSSSST